jgi:hypothetical protein
MGTVVGLMFGWLLLCHSLPVGGLWVQRRRLKNHSENENDNKSLSESSNDGSFSTKEEPTKERAARLGIVTFLCFRRKSVWLFGIPFN